MKRRFRLTTVIALLLLLPLGFALPAAAATPNAVFYLVALSDNGTSGMLIGCGDSLVPVQTQLQSDGTTVGNIRAALTQLFAIKTAYYGNSGLYDALYENTISIDSVTMDGNTAVVRLSGAFNARGVCDDPRIEQQLTQTILQFHGVYDARIYRNGEQVFVPPAGQYFDVTGHWVTGRFLQVWQQSGGLPVFGYPLSGVIDENGVAVQYFERQRFEYHPANPAPYDVLLGLLGDTARDQRGLANTAPFQPLPANTGSDANCTFFPQTRHRLCFGFRAYWMSHGLNFGDPGTSYREALALYGYPISEEFTDPASGLTTQYFERAVFQYQPLNQPPWDVLLQRLGAGALAANH